MQQLDLVTKMNGYSPNGISYSEGQMPLGLGAESGICDHGYCPQESEEIEINPREGEGMHNLEWCVRFFLFTSLSLSLCECA